MIKLQRPTILLSAALLLALAPSADKVAFHPADGTQAPKSFAIAGEFNLDDFTLVVDGQDVSGMVSPGEASFSLDLGLAVVDHYLETVDGKPLLLEREFIKSTGEFGSADSNESKENMSELDGETVVFKWNTETSEYDRTFKDGDGDQESLESLGIDLDYVALLPGKDVADGDTWTVEPKALGSALFFGFDFEHLPDMGDGDAEAAAVLEKVLPQIEKLFEGFKTECKYAGMREVDGTQLAAIKVQVSSDGSIDLTDMLLELIQEQSPVEVAMDIAAATLGAKIRGEGELLWDAKAGRAHAFEMKADIEINLDFEASVDAQGQSQTIEAGMELSGTANWSMAKTE